MEHKTFKEFLTSVHFGFIASVLIFIVVIFSIPMESNVFLNDELRGTHAHEVYQNVWRFFMLVVFLIVCFTPLRKIESLGDIIGIIFIVVLGPITLLSVSYSYIWKRYYKIKNGK